MSRRVAEVGLQELGLGLDAKPVGALELGVGKRRAADARAVICGRRSLREEVQER